MILVSICLTTTNTRETIRIRKIFVNIDFRGYFIKTKNSRLNWFGKVVNNCCGWRIYRSINGICSIDIVKY